MMSRTAFWRVVWKEYRTQRAFWLGMLAITVVLELLYVALTFVSSGPERPGAAFLMIIAMGLSTLYAAGCGATMFATEHEEGTYEFQRTLPTTPLGVLLGKLAFAITSAYVLLGVVCLFTVILWRYTDAEVRPSVVASLWAVWWSAPLEMLAWGVLFSLLVARPLVAALLAITAGSVTFYALAPAALGEWGRHAGPFWLRAAIVVALAAAIVWLTRRWFHTPPAPLDAMRRLLRWPEGSEGVGERSSGARLQRSTAFGRLLWQQWRQSWPMMAAIGVVIIVFAWVEVWVWNAPGFGEGARLVYLIGMACIVASLAGAGVFLGDQRRGHRHFLAEHGTKPASLWLSRQIIWFVPLLVLTLGLLAIFVAEGRSPWWLDQAMRRAEPWFREDFAESTIVAVSMTLIGCLFGFTCLGFGAGQLCSMFLRSGILAAVFGLMLAGLLCGWAALMLALEVNWVWSVWPIAIALLVATRLRTADWLLERNSLRAWLPVGACLLVPMIAILIAVPCYRVYSIPVVDPGFSPEQYVKPLSAEAQETARLYQRALQCFYKMVSPNAEGKEVTLEKKKMTEEELKASAAAALKAKKEAIALTLEASRRPTCDAIGNVAQPWENGTYYYDLLGRLLLDSAQESQQAGDLGKALEYYLAALRVSGHMRFRTVQSGGFAVSEADEWEDRVYEALVVWAAQPKQTAERIVGAMRQLDAIDRLRPSPTDAIKTSYLVARGLVMGDPKALEAEMGRDPRGVFHIVLWNYLLPWEKYRSLRMLNLLTNQELRRWNDRDALLRGVSEARSGEYCYLSDRSPYSFFLPAWEVMWHSPEVVGERLAVEVAFMTTCRRATWVQLALEAWKAKHGKLPKSLDELVGTYLDKLPEDPFTIKPFEYFPEGLSVSTRRPPFVSRDSSGYYGYPVGNEVSAGMPIVWSAGPRVSITHREAGDDRPPEYYSVGVLEQCSMAVSPLDARMRGWAFPVP